MDFDYFNLYTIPFIVDPLVGIHSIPGLSQSLGASPGRVLVPALSCPLLSTHQQCPVDPWHWNELLKLSKSLHHFTQAINLPCSSVCQGPPAVVGTVHQSRTEG